MELDPEDSVDAIALAWLRERPQTPVDSIGIVTRLWHAAKLLGDDRARLLREAGADAATLDLLSTLRRSGPPYRLTTRELADAALITAGAITQRVDRAERQGLVTRSAQGEGSRRVDVELTDLGHATVERLVDAVLERELALLDGFPADEVEQLNSLLRQLLSALHTSLGDRRPGHVGEL
ncbi:MarR family transcriptional regulator [Mycolicibacterium sp. 624]|uniref:MarR family winged helix-turn-helix transcriptional regulator n=1 Tax=Mycolicibacterium sp. 624 TaxID=3156314 RepID=UPI0033938A65